MQPSHPLESIMHVHIQLYVTYWMTPTVFSWGTPQQQQQFLMTTYMPLDHPVLLSVHSKASRWFPLSLAKVCAQKGTDVLRNKSAISGAVLGPVRVAAA